MYDFSQHKVNKKNLKYYSHIHKIIVNLHKNSQNMNNLGASIRMEREKRGFSQEYVAMELGINQSTYGKLERDASNITVDRLFKIADVLETDVSNLLDIGKKNVWNVQTNHGNGYVETINNDYKYTIDELKTAYEKMLGIKDEQIAFLKEMLGK